MSKERNEHDQASRLKNFLMLNSPGHEISTSHKNENTEKYFFSA